MNSSTTGALLAHDKADRYRSFGAFGKPAYQSHLQLRAMLKSKRGDRYANYFAKPTVDPDSGELRWTAEVPGAPRAWNAMSAEDQAKHALDLEVIRSGLLGYAAELRQQGGQGPGGAAAFASLLEQAMKVPAGDNFLYFIGDQPVIAFWGFEDASRGSVDPAAQAPRYGAPPAAPAPVDAPAAAPVAVEIKRKRPWWWWLLWALLALLLLALLLLLLRACTPGGGIDLKRALPGAPELPEGSASLPRGALGGGGTVAQGGGAGGAVDGSTRPDDGAQGGATTPPQVPDAGASAPGSDSPPNDGTQPQPPDGETPKPDENPPKPDGTTQPPKPEDRDKDGTKPPKADDKSIKLPDNPDAAKKMDFLEGQWKAGDGLFDRQTGRPLDIGLKFGKDGQGEVSVRRPDGSTCRGAVQGRVSAGKLGIAGSQSIPCSDGTQYAAPKIECQKERGGQTQCYGINADGSRYNMDLAKK